MWWASSRLDSDSTAYGECDALAGPHVADFGTLWRNLVHTVTWPTSRAPPSPFFTWTTRVLVGHRSAGPGFPPAGAPAPTSGVSWVD